MVAYGNRPQPGSVAKNINTDGMCYVGIGYRNVAGTGADSRR